jgi:predicted DNA-binding transcriptional regulator AlpA
MRNSTVSNVSDLLDQHEVAAMCGVSVHTVRYWRRRSVRQGPPWIRLGYKRVRYDRGDVLAFASRERAETYRASAD